MSEIAIRVEHLTKKYTIGKQKDSSLRGSLASLFSGGKSTQEEFIALNDVSFDIQQGDVVGIIGKNGAGKSTLLKILSQITKPTEGRIEINGRVASLLEVGTGFHPELTGRENIYLNGTILGMTRKEVKSKFDEIVDFSGVEKFIDTPVKHYSSGMYVRLAFAVAAHLEPEILVIDEVLAVGDAEFQKKCLGKMKDVAGQGRTVLFVSHNMAAVKTLCNKGIVFDHGKIVESGNINTCLERYYNLEKSDLCSKVYEEDKRPSSSWASLVSYELLNAEGMQTNVHNVYDSSFLDISYEIKELSGKNDYFLLNLHILDSDNNYFFVTSVDQKEGSSEIGTYKARFELPPNYFNVGFYRVGIALTSYPGTLVHFFENPAFSFEVTEDDMSFRNVPFNGEFPGVSRIQLPYKIKKI
jgi:lipopolysaccharide transport system ATP-binding protein